MDDMASVEKNTKKIAAWKYPDDMNRISLFQIPYFNLNFLKK